MSHEKLHSQHSYSIVKVKDNAFMVFLSKKGDLTRGREFFICARSPEGIQQHMDSLTDQQCSDFMKTAKPFNFKITGSENV